MVKRLAKVLGAPRSRVLAAVCLVLLGAPIAGADVLPPEEGACLEKHRAGDVCTDWDKQKRGICQPSTCLRVDRSRPTTSPQGYPNRSEVSCLKCVWTHRKQKPKSSCSCSIGDSRAANCGASFEALAVATIVGLGAVRRRRRLSNKPLQRIWSPQRRRRRIAAPGWRRPDR